jgi:hypothetical protein
MPEAKETETETRRCSDCKCTILLSYFSKNRRGAYYKTCDRCRCRHKCSYSDCTYKTNKKKELQKHKIAVHQILCSKGERDVMEVLNSLNVCYLHNNEYAVQLAYEGPIKWNFVIKTTGDPIFIEYDDIYHIELFRGGGMPVEEAQENLEYIKAIDKIKNDYCDDNAYLLLRIPHYEHLNISKILIDFMKEHTNVQV